MEIEKQITLKRIVQCFMKWLNYTQFYIKDIIIRAICKVKNTEENL